MLADADDAKEQITYLSFAEVILFLYILYVSFGRFE